MSKTHIVKQGEHLSEIAKQNGFRDFHTVWNHPGNAALRAARDPHVLVPGDKLFIPDPKPKTEKRPTGALHTFAVAVNKLFLRLRLLDFDGKPISGATCDVALRSGQPADNVNTDGKGIMEDPVDPATHRGEVTAHVPPPKSPPPTPLADNKVKIELRIGHLNPEFKLSGQQARLNNL